MKNRLYIISGPSGSGKSSIARAVMDNEIISFTTRAPRPGEVNGRDYIFISEDEFQYLYNNNGLAEHTSYYGSANYGITMEELMTKLSKGDAFVVVDIVGKEQLEKLWDNTLSIFVFMPYTDVAISRMIRRGDSKENIEKRLRTYEEEIANFPQYDVLLDNCGDFQTAVEGFKRIVGGYFDSQLIKRV
jgi:guanylate kinase